MEVLPLAVFPPGRGCSFKGSLEIPRVGWLRTLLEGPAFAGGSSIEITTPRKGFAWNHPSIGRVTEREKQLWEERKGIRPECP